VGIIVDAYIADEQAMGWHIYLEETMDFPFDTGCIEEQEVSPLEKRGRRFVWSANRHRSRRSTSSS
jgi:hypothetical protein